MGWLPSSNGADRRPLWWTLAALPAMVLLLRYGTPWVFSDLSPREPERNVVSPAPPADPGPAARPSPGLAESLYQPSEPAPEPEAAAAPANARPELARSQPLPAAPRRPEPSRTPPVQALTLSPSRPSAAGGASRTSASFDRPKTSATPEVVERAAAPNEPAVAAHPPAQIRLQPFFWDAPAAAVRAAAPAAGRFDSPAAMMSAGHAARADSRPQAASAAAPDAPASPQSSSMQGAAMPGAGPLPAAGDASSPPSASPIVRTAEQFMMSPPLNPNNGTHDWDNWCLGFVGDVSRTAQGRQDPQLAAYDARGAYFLMQKAGRLNTDLSQMPPGAAVFWPYASAWGHIAIYSGSRDGSGSPLIITTTGWSGWSGIKMMSQTQLRLGPPAGWSKL